MADLNKSKGDVASMAKYKSNFSYNNMKALMAENEGLKKENKIVTSQRDSTVVVLGDLKNNEALVGQNEELAKAVEKLQN
jgi:hypothetical protein